MANTDSQTIPYLIQEYGLKFVAYKDKNPYIPYITVSSKGVANGLSDKYNDGADFGPDSVDSNGNLTQTAGIQEGINYAFENGLSTIKLTPGKFKINAWSTYNDASYGNMYIGIVLPYVLGTADGGQEEYRIRIEGSGGNAPNNIAYQSNAPEYAENDTVLDFTALPALSGTDLGALIWTPSSPSYNTGYLNVELRNFDVITLTAPTYDGISTQFASTATIEYVAVNAPYSSTAPADSNAVGYGSAFIFPKSLNQASVYGNMLSAFGFMTGYYISSHGHLGNLLAMDCYRAVVLGQYYHASEIALLYTAYCAIGIFTHDTTSPNPTLFVHLWDNGGLSTTGWNTYYVLVSDNNNNTLQGYANLFVRYGLSIPDSIRYGATKFAIYNVNPLVQIYATNSPTIPANPPVSATVYQNTNPFDIRIYLPAYATTAGTAGSVAIALGSSSTPATIGTKFINGSTSDTSTEIIDLVVPAGWYYEFTATDTTLGTATVVPA